MPLLGSDAAYRVFESELEAVRRHYGFVVAGYVLMPEHVHLLVSEPRVASLAIALQVLKRNVPGLWSSTCSGQLRGAYGPPRIGLSK
jgi:putative transposase